MPDPTWRAQPTHDLTRTGSAEVLDRVRSELAAAAEVERSTRGGAGPAPDPSEPIYLDVPAAAQSGRVCGFCAVPVADEDAHTGWHRWLAATLTGTGA